VGLLLSQFPEELDSPEPFRGSGKPTARIGTPDFLRESSLEKRARHWNKTPGSPTLKGRLVEPGIARATPARTGVACWIFIRLIERMGVEKTVEKAGEH